MRPGFDPWVRKIPWRREWSPTPVFLPGKFHGLRSLVGYSPWGSKESDTTERLHVHVHVLYCRVYLDVFLQNYALPCDLCTIIYSISAMKWKVDMSFQGKKKAHLDTFLCLTIPRAPLDSSLENGASWCHLDRCGQNSQST